MAPFLLFILNSEVTDNVYNVITASKPGLITGLYLKELNDHHCEVTTVVLPLTNDDPVLWSCIDARSPIQCEPCFQTVWITEGKGWYTFTYYTHADKTHTHTRICTIPQRPLCCLDVGAAIVIFNDGEAGPGEASVSTILSGVFTDSAHQYDTDVGQRRGNAAHSSHSVEQEKSGLWLDKSASTFKVTDHFLTDIYNDPRLDRVDLLKP